MITLHYLFEPLSGACHGAAPLIRAACEVVGIRLALHAGGLWAGENRCTITPQWREEVMAQDQRIARLSRQPFGEAYFDGLLGEAGRVIDSTAPSAAILAAEELAGRGLVFALRVQQAYFVEGRHVSERPVLQDLAAELCFDVGAFEAACVRLEGEATGRHFAQTREWLARAGGKGYPTVVLERADGLLVPINIHAWYGRPADFASALGRVVLTAGAG